MWSIVIQTVQEIVTIFYSTLIQKTRNIVLVIRLSQKKKGEFWKALSYYKNAIVEKKAPTTDIIVNLFEILYQQFFHTVAIFSLCFHLFISLAFSPSSIQDSLRLTITYLQQLAANRSFFQRWLSSNMYAIRFYTNANNLNYQPTFNLFHCAWLVIARGYSYS